MKYHMSFLIALILIHLSCSPERSEQSRQQTPPQTAPQAANASTISLGMNHSRALEIIRELGGQDGTSSMAIQGPKGEKPLDGQFWSFEEYDSILEIGAEDGKLVVIGYWTGADFSRNKVHRVKSRRSLKSLTFDKETRTVKTQVV